MVICSRRGIGDTLVVRQKGSESPSAVAGSFPGVWVSIDHQEPSKGGITGPLLTQVDGPYVLRKHP